MPDVADIANDLAQWRLERVLEAHGVASSLESCRDCHDGIPLERQMAVPGCSRCAECQANRENREAAHAR